MHKAVRSQTRDGKRLDVRFGLTLLRDRRIPFAAKLLALALGAGGMALLLALELPMEGLLAVFVPFLGLPFDLALDGLEAVVGTLVLSALLLPFLAPKPLVASLRAERLNAHPIPVPSERTRRITNNRSRSLPAE